jgi:hypothetical protein
MPPEPTVIPVIPPIPTAPAPSAHRVLWAALGAVLWILAAGLAVLFARLDWIAIHLH